MIFACQKDSFLKSFTSKVISCEPSKLKSQQNGKQIEEDCYEVVCEDTVLFPEGGGQPYDKGYLNDIEVEQVLRRGAQAVHFVKEQIPVGTEVNQTVDWDRRLDHMQQHSGQHLITAVASSEYKYETTSWWLGESVSHIELDTTKITKEEMMRIETVVNKKILEQIPVNVTIIENEKNCGDVRARGLPKDHQGPIRIVEIEGLENNMCCGTHVNNLIQLQSIKLLYFEKGKKNKTNLFFIVGGRVLKYLTDCLNRENKLTVLLKNNAEKHVELVQKLQTSAKADRKRLSNVLKELAKVEADKIMLKKTKFYCQYYKDGDSEYLESLVRCLKENVGDTLLVFAVGEEKGPGNILLYGEPSFIDDLSPRIMEELDGKGTKHGNKYQGKVNNLKNFSKVCGLVEEYFKALNLY